MAGTIKGIIVEIGGDTSGLQKALKNVNSASSSLTKELRGVNSLLKLDPANTVLVSQKQEILAQNIQETSEKLRILRQTQEQADSAIANGTKVSDENYRNLQREIINTENKLKDLQLQASKWTQAGKAIEEYGSKIQNLGKKIDDVGNKLTTRLTLPIAALGVAGIQSAAKQEAAMQQVELIYGDAADSVKDFAENTAIAYNMSTSEAYKYSQIYGNLIQSITDDEEENALYTQQLLKASSVIASATGRTMEDVMDRIRSGLLGNTEAIEDLGVNVNVSLLESTDAFKKFAGDKSWNQLDFQTQQQIRLFGILEQTTKKYGNEVNKNTSSDIQRVTARFKNLTSELNKKLLPVAEDLIEIANDFLNKLDDLTDEEQENIIKIGLFVAAAGPLVKILGTATTVVGGVTKGIGLFSQALSVMKNNTTSSSTAVNNLAKGLKSVASPAGIATTALALYAAGVAYVKTKVDEELKSTTELIEQLQSATETRKSSIEAIENQRDASLAEIDNVKMLRDELSTLVDENGKVKEGYEARAQFILNELNEALGTEYKLNDNIIKSYEKMQDSIDELILKKKAQLILEADEEAYQEAIRNKTQAMQDYLSAQDELNKLLPEYNKLAEEQKRGFIGSEYSLVEASTKMKEYGERIQELKTNINEQDRLLKQYNDSIVRYNENSELMIEGGAENYKKIEQSVAITQANITASANAGIAERINNQIQANAETKRLYDLEAQYNKDAKDSIYATNVEEGKKQLQLLADDLIARTSTVSDLGEDEVSAWKNLANNAYDEYNYALGKMPVETRKKIEEMTGVISKNTSVEEATIGIARKVESGFNDNVDPETWGKDLVQLLTKGASNINAINGLKGTITGIADMIRKILGFSVPEEGPLSNFDKSMPDMIDLMTKGIDNNSYKLENSAKRLATKLNSTLNSELLLNYSKLQGQLSSQVINSSKTIFTTPQIIFNVQELDEAKLQQCFNYVNRKFGSKY